MKYVELFSYEVCNLELSMEFLYWDGDNKYNVHKTHIGLAITKTLYIVTRWLYVLEDLIAKDFCLVSLQLFPILMDDSMKTKGVPFAAYCHFL